MRTSISTTSGSQPRRPAPRPRAPSAASPTTSRSAFVSRIMRKPPRTSAWSSAISTRMRHRAASSGRRAWTRKPPPRQRPGLERAAEHRGALAHARRCRGPPPSLAAAPRRGRRRRRRPRARRRRSARSPRRGWRRRGAACSSAPPGRSGRRTGRRRRAAARRVLARHRDLEPGGAQRRGELVEPVEARLRRRRARPRGRAHAAEQPAQLARAPRARPTRSSAAPRAPGRGARRTRRRRPPPARRSPRRCARSRRAARARSAPAPRRRRGATPRSIAARRLRAASPSAQATTERHREQRVLGRRGREVERGEPEQRGERGQRQQRRPGGGERRRARRGPRRGNTPCGASRCTTSPPAKRDRHHRDRMRSPPVQRDALPERDHRSERCQPWRRARAARTRARRRRATARPASGIAALAIRLASFATSRARPQCRGRTRPARLRPMFSAFTPRTAAARARRSCCCTASPTRGGRGSSCCPRSSASTTCCADAAGPRGRAAARERPRRRLLPDAVERAMDEAGFETAHMVGNSLGGFVALQLAARGRARSVVAFAPAGGWARRRRLLPGVARPSGDDGEQAKAGRAARARDRVDRRRPAAATRLSTVNFEHIPAELLAHQLLASQAAPSRDPADRLRASVTAIDLDAERIDLPRADRVGHGRPDPPVAGEPRPAFGRTGCRTPTGSCSTASATARSSTSRWRPPSSSSASRRPDRGRGVAPPAGDCDVPPAAGEWLAQRERGGRTNA